MNEDKLKAQLNYIELELAKKDFNTPISDSMNLDLESPIVERQFDWIPKKPEDIINDLSEIVNELRIQSESFRPRFVIGTKVEIESLRKISRNHD